jgi:cytochrome c oxidase subunit 4
MAHENRPNYLLVWLGLVILVIVSIVASMTLPKRAALFVIFTVAVIKALLVALNFMHLRYERRWLYALAIIPLIIVAVLLFALFPDFVFRG